MSHTVKIYDTCIGCTQCVRACPTDVLEMVPWDGCKAGQIASSPRTEDCVGCFRCETACPTDFLSIRVYLGSETTRSMGLAYQVYSRLISDCLFVEVGVERGSSYFLSFCCLGQYAYTFQSFGGVG